MSSEYKVENDEYYKSFAFKTSRNERTTEHYKKVLRKFCRATGKTLTEIITTCIDEQSIVTTIKLDPDENGNERKKELKFNINSKDAAINKFLNQFEDYCFKKNNKQITIENQTDMVRSFLHENGVELPKRKSYEDDSRDWYLPSKIDFNYLLQDASLVHASLANMLSSSGMRVSDALSMSIGDFMKATADYHDFVDVEDFIDNAPDDMIAQWVFEPRKTKRHHVNCITFSSAHTSNLILQNLRHIKNHYLPYKNRTEGLNLSISKKDPLFGSRKKKYKSPPNGRSVASYWIEKNKKFREWKINQIKQQIENGKISKEDYDEAVSKIPHFHPHVCRKFFCTTVSNNCGDIRVCALLEGHSDGLPNDLSYIKKSVEDIKEIYINNIHDALSLDNVETKIISNKETEELNKKVAESDKKIEALTNENAEKDKEIAELRQAMAETQEQVAQTNKAFEELTLKRDRTHIRNLITEHFYDNYRDDILQKEYAKDGEQSIGLKKCVVICEIAYEIALEKESEFKETDAYLNSIINQAIAKCSFNPDLIIPKYNEIHDKNIQLHDINGAIADIVADVIIILADHEDIWDMVKEDQKTLKATIIGHIQNSNYDINNISSEDRQTIAENVIMEYLAA